MKTPRRLSVAVSVYSVSVVEVIPFVVSAMCFAIFRLGFRTLFGIVGDVEVGSAMVAMAMSCVDIDPQRTVTLVVPRREALLANGFNDTAGMSADIDMIISKISHISVFLFLPFEKEILSCINNSSFAGYLCVIKTILIPLLQEGGELR